MWLEKLMMILILLTPSRLNELAFSEQPDVTSTPDAAPQKEGLLASAYRLTTAPFSMKTPKNVTTRNRKKI